MVPDPRSSRNQVEQRGPDPLSGSFRVIPRYLRQEGVYIYFMWRAPGSAAQNTFKRRDPDKVPVPLLLTTFDSRGAALAHCTEYFKVFLINVF